MFRVTAALKILRVYSERVLKPRGRPPVFSHSSNHTMKNDHSLTFTAAVVLAGVVLAFVNPAGANSSESLATGPAGNSSNLHNIVSVIAASDAGTMASLNGAKQHKGTCHRMNHTDPHA